MKSNSLLIRMKSEDAGMRIEADRIERSTERLESFTRSILNYASSSATVNQGRAEFCARAALEDCVREFFPARAADIAIAPGSGPAVIRGDRAKLGQVYLNLIRNSFEAGARKVAVSFSGEAGILRIRLEDDGRGCPEAELPSLGKPFYTTRKEQGGTGLGIAISRAIIEGFGGILSYQSLRAYGNGSAGMAASIELPSATPIASNA